MYLSLWDDFIYEQKPSIKLQQDGDTKFVELELPGFKKEEIKVSVEGQYVSVNAEKKNKKYQEMVWMPKTVDASTVKAKLEDGVLTLRFNTKTGLKKEVLVE